MIEQAVASLVLISVEKMTILILFNAIDVSQNFRAYLLSKISASCLILELLHLKLSSKKNYVAIKKSNQQRIDHIRRNVSPIIIIIIIGNYNNNNNNKKQIKIEKITNIYENTGF